MEDKNVCFYCGKEINENNKTEQTENNNQSTSNQ